MALSQVVDRERESWVEYRANIVTQAGHMLTVSTLEMDEGRIDPRLGVH